MNHKTLADFRVSHGVVSEQLLVDSFAARLRSGIASLDRVAQDGVRVRAAADRLRWVEAAVAAAEALDAGRRKRDGKASGRAAKAMPRDPARDRFAPRSDGTEAVTDWRACMNTDGAKTIYRQRVATAERVDAQARNSGLTRLIVRGIDKARAVACWYGLANDMTCAWRHAAA